MLGEKLTLECFAGNVAHDAEGLEAVRFRFTGISQDQIEGHTDARLL